MTVRDPEGQVWRVTRRWVPWRRRAQRIDTTGFSDLDLSDGVVMFFVCLILAPIIVLALLVATEFLLLLLLLPFAVLARAAFGRQWIVEARRGFTIWWDAPSGDWQASGLRIHEIADAIRLGDPPPRTIGAPAEVG